MGFVLIYVYGMVGFGVEFEGWIEWGLRRRRVWGMRVEGRGIPIISKHFYLKV